MRSCYQDQMLDLEQAQQQILQSIQSVADTQSVTLESALGRVLAEPVYSFIPVPPFRNSAMDGYAIACDQPLEVGASFKVVGTSLAGAPYRDEVLPDQAIRIMTGAVVPDGADTVIMQEHIDRDGDMATTAHAVKPGQNVRHAGEDLEQGALVFTAGRKLSAIDLGVLASVGCAEVVVYRKPKVALFCTGDELKQPDEVLSPGDIYNSNRFMLQGLLNELGVEVIDLGVVEDNPESLEQTLLNAAEQADAIISTGGVSVGDADYVKEVMQRIGEIGFWKVAIKPGKPFAFGKFKQCDFYGLPGNPVSSAITFKLLVEPALQKTSGQSPTQPVKLQARAEQDFKKRPGRMDFQRGVLSHSQEGELLVKPADGQGSHQLFSLANADALVCLPKHSEGVKAGELTEVWLLSR